MCYSTASINSIISTAKKHRCGAQPFHFPTSLTTHPFQKQTERTEKFKTRISYRQIKLLRKQALKGTLEMGQALDNMQSPPTRERGMK